MIKVPPLSPRAPMTCSAVLRDIYDLLEEFGVPVDEIALQRGEKATPEYAARLFIAILAHRCRISFYLGDEDLTSEVTALFESKWENETIANVDVDLLLSICGLDTLTQVYVPGFLTVIAISLEITNRILATRHVPLDAEAQEALHDVKTFLVTDRLNQEPLRAFCHGNIREHNGAYVWGTSVGDVQIGIPPSTIKAWLRHGLDPPSVYVLPENLFDFYHVNTADIEFPIYFNHFVKQGQKDASRRIKLVGSRHQLDRVACIFSESVFGPSKENVLIDEEIAPELKAVGYAINFAAERHFLAGHQPGLEAFVDMLALTDGRVVFEHKGVQVSVESRDNVLLFSEDGVRTGVLDASDSVLSLEPANGTRPPTPGGGDPSSLRGSDRSRRPKVLPPTSGALLPRTSAFEPPVFGVTFLGTSHGFDAHGETTGFIIWLNQSGVLVDPPFSTLELLNQWGIRPRFLKHVILTHCHSDHDGGLLRLLLSDEKMTVHTTKTVNNGFRRKMEALTGRDDLHLYYDFSPVMIGRRTRILGAEFDFDYSLHTIPCVRFRVFFNGRSIAYSADTFFDPRSFAKLVADGVINTAREMSLRQFVFDADCIIHEAGVPPIHTPVSALNALPDSIKAKLYVVHCSGLPKTVQFEVGSASEPGRQLCVPVTGLRMARVGPDNTIALPTTPFVDGVAFQSRLFEYFCSISFLNSCPPVKLHELISCSVLRQYKAGEVLIRQGEISDEFFVILSGEVGIYCDPDRGEGTEDDNNVHEASLVGGGESADAPEWRERLIPLKTYMRGDYLGEQALRERKKRTAYCITHTDAQLLVLHAADFRRIMQSTVFTYVLDEPQQRTERLARYRTVLRNILSVNPLFHGLTYEIDEIAMCVEEARMYLAGETVIEEGDESTSLYLVQSGVIALQKKDRHGRPKDFLRLTAGDSFGEMSLINGQPRSATAVARAPSVLLELKRTAFLGLLDRFQGLRFNATTVAAQRAKESTRLRASMSRRRSSRSKRRSSGSSQSPLVAGASIPPTPEEPSAAAPVKAKSPPKLSRSSSSKKQRRSKSMRTPVKIDEEERREKKDKIVRSLSDGKNDKPLGAIGEC